MAALSLLFVRRLALTFHLLSTGNLQFLNMLTSVDLQLPHVTEMELDTAYWDWQQGLQSQVQFRIIRATSRKVT